jgi:hypothetical protein
MKKEVMASPRHHLHPRAMDDGSRKFDVERSRFGKIGYLSL